MTASPHPMDRRDWMSLLAKADPAQLADLMPDLPAHSFLRPPEIGAVMVQGRIGGTGAPFNLGEMTVTRCALRLDTGAVGHGYVQGRDKAHATRAAVLDALMQTDAGETLRRVVLDPIAQTLAQRQAGRAARAAATKVDFFTMMRGEDQ
jgi:alpha-D-ribose 1-methylphosphonate 5-triphosphate synthase subunit PhnG